MPALQVPKDEGPYDQVFSLVGGATVAAEAARYGGAGLKIASMGDRFQGEVTTENLFGSGDFTVELDIRADTVTDPLTNEVAPISVWAGTSLSWLLGITKADRRVTWYVSANGPSGDFSRFSAANVFALSTWQNVAVSRVAGVLRVYVEGTKVIDTPDTTNYFSPPSIALAIGAHAGDGGRMSSTFIDNVRITKGVGRYTANSIAVGDLAIGAADPHWANVSLLLRGAAKTVSQSLIQAPTGTVAEAPTWPMSTKSPLQASLAKDVYFGGRGRVAGTVKTKGSPNFATYAKVRLINEHDGVCIREQWSNSLTGEYSFDFLDMTLKYTVVAYDPAKNFRAVIADNLTPSLIT